MKPNGSSFRSSRSVCRRLSCIQRSAIRSLIGAVLNSRRGCCQILDGRNIGLCIISCTLMDKRKEQVGVNTRGERQSHLYVVAYDIPDNKRRTRVHKLLKGFGQWTEFSL